MTKRRALIYGGAGLGGLLALALIGLAILWGIQAGQVLPNTTVAGTDVSGMTEDEVRSTITPLAEARRTDPVGFTFEGRTIEVTPEEVGYSIDADATTQAVLARGRQGLPGDIAERIRSLRTTRDFALVDDYDAAEVTSWVSDLAADVDREITSGSVTVDPESLEVEVVMPTGSVEVRQSETAASLIEAMLSPGPDELALPADTEPQEVPDEDVQAVAAQVERAVADTLTLSSGDETLELSPRDVATIIEVVEQPTATGATLELMVTADAVSDVVSEEDAARFEQQPRNARYLVDRAPPVTFDTQGSVSFQPVSANVEVEPGRDGTRFDPELAAEQITELLRAGDRGGDLRLETIEADFPTQLAEELRPSHLLGTFTTYHPAGQDRVVNIQKLADEVDGVLTLPGEQFSINETSGRRTCERGYRPAGTIVRGELTDTCGGGTSQFGTTTLNAAFFAGVQLDQWKAHSWYFSRYPMGREATLNYPELDVRFTNNTDGAVIVKTSYTAGSITVSLYGQPIASSVSASHGSPTNRTTPGEERRTTNELFEDQERVVQSGFGGFTVQVVRTIDLLEGETVTETIRTVYVPQDRIVEVGTRSRPTPPPEPDPEPDDGPDDSDDGDSEA
jgi:vancomycin resistance protein YoaR